MKYPFLNTLIAATLSLTAVADPFKCPNLVKKEYTPDPLAVPGIGRLPSVAGIGAYTNPGCTDRYLVWASDGFKEAKALVKLNGEPNKPPAKYFQIAVWGDCRVTLHTDLEGSEKAKVATFARDGLVPVSLLATQMEKKIEMADKIIKNAVPNSPEKRVADEQLNKATQILNKVQTAMFDGEEQWSFEHKGPDLIRSFWADCETKQVKFPPARHA